MRTTVATIQGPAADDDGVRARRKNECVPHGIIWQGWWPWQVRNRCCRSSKKLLAKARLTEMFKKCWVSYESARARGMRCWQFFVEKPLVFWCFYVKIAANTKVLEGFRLARANVHFTLFFARDYWSLVMLEQEMSFYMVFCKGKRITTKQPDLDHLELPEASSRKWWKCGCGLGAARGARTRGPNNNYSLELIMFNNVQQQKLLARGDTPFSPAPGFS